MDSVGGTCKNAAKRFSRANPGSEIRNAQDFCNFLANGVSVTIPFVITREEILKAKPFLQDRFNRARPFDGTRSYHSYECDPDDEDYLIIRKHTGSEQFIRFKIFKD